MFGGSIVEEFRNEEVIFLDEHYPCYRALPGTAARSNLGKRQLRMILGTGSKDMTPKQKPFEQEDLGSTAGG